VSFPPALIQSVIIALSAAASGPEGGMVPWSTAWDFIRPPFETILALVSRFNPPEFDGDTWHPDEAQLLVTIDLTAKNFGPGVLSGFGSGLESSLFEQEKVNPVIAKMLMIKISFLIVLLFLC
jgi:hypothetical protein